MQVRSKIKIFLAGDTDGRQADKKYLLENMGYTTVFSFASPEACMRRLPLRPDLVLLPCPVKSPQGIEMLRRIQSYNRQTMVMYVGDAPETGIAAAMRRAEKTCSYRRLKDTIVSKIKAITDIRLFSRP